MSMVRDAVRGTVAGFAGTSAMTATLWLERRLRTKSHGPVDYDASQHVVTAAAKVMHIQPRTDAQRQAIFLLVHWGYGSVVGAMYDAIRARVGDDRRATIIFYLACQAMAFTLFPVLGGTPPPWRWRRDLLASSLVQHAIYAGTVAAADRRAR